MLRFIALLLAYQAVDYVGLLGVWTESDLGLGNMNPTSRPARSHLDAYAPATSGHVRHLSYAVRAFHCSPAKRASARLPRGRTSRSRKAWGREAARFLGLLSCVRPTHQASRPAIRRPLIPM